MRFGSKAVCNALSISPASLPSISRAMMHSKGSGTLVVYSPFILSSTSGSSVMPIFTIPGIAGLVNT